MAKPRVFLSSTYYDMRVVRADLERFVHEQGYEPVLFERGHVPYGAEEKLEEDCYREISTCDVLVSVIGGKFGTESKDTRYSISQNELKTAVKMGKQVYVFVERAVLAEYGTYTANKTVAGFVPTAVNDIRVFKFLEEVHALSGRNPVQPFEISEDITTFLREQWAGLFQMLLTEHARRKEVDLIERLEETSTTLDQLVKFLTEERGKGDQTIKDILLSNHPIFAALKKMLAIPYRVFFENLSEMDALLEARRTKPLDPEDWDDAAYREYVCSWYGKDKQKLVKVAVSLFDAKGRLKVIQPGDWKPTLVSVADLPTLVEQAGDQ